MRTFKHYSRLAAINVVVTVLLLAILEGIAGLVLVTRDVTRDLGFPDLPHVQYDAELGWIGKPNVTIPNAYGPGMSIRTNSQGFRENRDVSTTTPAGHVRMICSGDSFTFGEGVDGDHAWCRLLTALNSRLETVNMGQGAYGVDQAYLWYNRAGARLQPRLHLFAFITEDVDRMLLDEFTGYPKPYLTIQDGALTVKNVPVPRTWLNPWRSDLSGLRLLELVRRIRGRVFTVPSDKGVRRASPQDAQTRQLLHHLFSELRRTNEAQGSRLMLVYLPTSSDEDQGAREWLAFFEAESRALGIPLIDLVSPFASLPRDRFVRMFIPGNGHYTVEGHELIANLLYRALETSAATSNLLTLPTVR